MINEYQNCYAVVKRDLQGHNPDMTLREHIEKSLKSESRRSLAVKVGVSAGTIGNILMGLHPNIATMRQFATYYKVPVDEFIVARYASQSESPGLINSHLRKSPAESTRRVIPLLTSVQAGIFVDRNVPPHAGESDEYIETDLRGKRIFALRVVGDSMEPLFRSGEVVIVDPDVQCEPGNYIVAKLPNHGSEDATIKQLKKFGEQFYLHPLNPNYEDILLTEEHKIVGKIVRKQMDF
jgi:SOS-response transcriptional repressor LexA